MRTIKRQITLAQLQAQLKKSVRDSKVKAFMVTKSFDKFETKEITADDVSIEVEEQFNTIMLFADDKLIMAWITDTKVAITKAGQTYKLTYPDGVITIEVKL